MALPRSGAAINMGKMFRADKPSLIARTPEPSGPRRARRRLIVALASVIVLLVLLISSIAWLGAKAAAIKLELEAAAQLVPSLKEDVRSARTEQALITVSRLRSHTGTANDLTGDALWTLASALPEIGVNFSAVTEIARAADDVANLALAPLAGVMQSLKWESLLPASSGSDLQPLATASPTISSAAHAVRASSERLHRIDTGNLLPQVAEPLAEVRQELAAVTGALDTAADVSQLAPNMLGAQETRSYLLIIQNNAEARASGGIPGAMAVLNFDKGKPSLVAQSSAGDVGVMSPPLPVDSEQQQIYSSRMGKFPQDINLTPDFPTAAGTAQAMWERKTGQRVDGVISIDPIALSYLLAATGPVQITDPELKALSTGQLPDELTSQNVVQTLLSDVYFKIGEPELQDVYFAAVAQRIFSSLSGGTPDAKGLLNGITRGVSEGRVLVWSALSAEQDVIATHAVSGSTTGASVSPAQFGVYFNDGTGAKMDYYVRRTVQLVKACPKDGYEETTVRISSTNTAPADAATSLPAYVTGHGNFGVPPGSVQTNIVAYGPVQANVETAKVDGQKTDFAPYLHSNRPVGITAIRLAPGESKTVEFTFGKIVQHTEPHVVVTPTVQAVNDVTLPTEMARCS